MKVGLTTSTALHMALIGFGLFAMSAPPPHQSAAVESFPIDIVPLEVLHDHSVDATGG